MLPIIFVHQGLELSNCKLAQVYVYLLYKTLLSTFCSLDIEGAEYGVLKTVPWDKVDIEVLLVELITKTEVLKQFSMETSIVVMQVNVEYLLVILEVLKVISTLKLVVVKDFASNLTGKLF